MYSEPCHRVYYARLIFAATFGWNTLLKHNTFSRFFVTFRTVSGVFRLPRMYIPQRSVPQFAPLHRLPERSMFSDI
jgi:hypothetical protein